jgi:peptidoglycan/LPS O-acetylase OafA/YrhL
MMTNKKLEFIDALRGIASLIVLIFHIVFLSRPNLQVPITFNKFIRFSGVIGVTLFFVISAFTLYLSTFNREGESNKTIKFYFRRLFRVAPLFYFMLVVWIINSILTSHTYPSLTTILLNITFTYNFSPKDFDSLVWAGWTVGVEMLFYSLLPLISSKVNTLNKSVMFAICTIIASKIFTSIFNHYIKGEVVFAKGADRYHYMNFMHQLPVFAIGIVCYFLYRKVMANAKNINRKFISSLLLVLFIFLFCVLINNNFNLLMPRNYWLALNFCILIVSLALKANKILVNKITCFYGKISYSIYLTHSFVIFYMRPLYQRVYTSFNFSTSLSFLICIVITLLVVTPVSIVAYYLIEAPAIKYGKLLIGKSRDILNPLINMKSRDLEQR